MRIINFHQDNIIESEIKIDPKHHRHFVARRGQVLRDIAEEYGGVTVSFPRSGIQSDIVTLKGAKNCVEGAKQRIAEIVAELVSNNSVCRLDLNFCYSDFFYYIQDQMVTIECIIPQKDHGTVMGSKGTKVQYITTEYDVQIKFPDREMRDMG